MTRRKRSTFLKDRRAAVRGARETPGYKSWEHMRGRCRNPKHASYSEYGERGITVCERWDDFDNFLDDMGERPPGMQVDRIDVDGNYEPKNCRWATKWQQDINRRVIRDSDHESLACATPHQRSFLWLARCLPGCLPRSDFCALKIA